MFSPPECWTSHIISLPPTPIYKKQATKMASLEINLDKNPLGWYCQRWWKGRKSPRLSKGTCLVAWIVYQSETYSQIISVWHFVMFDNFDNWLWKLHSVIWIISRVSCSIFHPTQRYPIQPNPTHPLKAYAATSVSDGAIWITLCCPTWEEY